MNIEKERDYQLINSDDRMFVLCVFVALIATVLVMGAVIWVLVEMMECCWSSIWRLKGIINDKVNDGVDKLPPGSMGRPFVGETGEFLEPHSATSIGRYMESHRARFGSVFKSHLFGHPTVVSTDAALNRYILQNEGKLFATSYPSSVCRILGKWSMIVLVGNPHKHMRALASAFTRPEKLHQPLFLRNVHSLVLSTLHSWPTHGTLPAAQHAKQFTFNLMIQQMLSMNPEEPDSVFFLREYQSFMKGLIALPIRLPGTSYHTALRSKDKILQKIKDTMVRRKQNPNVKYNDFLQFIMEDGTLEGDQVLDLVMNMSKDKILQKIKDTMVRRKQNPNVKYNDFLQFIMEDGTLEGDQVLDLVMNMVFAGHETSSVALTLAIGFLASCPRVLQKLRSEHQRVRSMKNPEDEFVSLEDYKAMDFTQCVIKETLRLGNVVRFVHREATEDVTFRGYTIPKGWKVLPIFSVPHLDKAFYEDPLRFNPERWKTAQNNAYFTPFGGGIRLCAGIELAKLEIALFLHHLVLNFDWALAEPHVDAMAFPFVDFPKGLPINVQKLH